jgi:formate dehydrogenase major subunit
MHAALDPNVHIMETKASTCGIRPGRRPRGKAYERFVEELRSYATEERTEPEEARQT